MPPKRPNVIFVITHDVGPVYGCYGNREIHSPNIDSLAKEAVRFDSHYCQWPLCGPSRANIFSGCRPLTTQRFNNQPFFARFRDRAPAGFRSLPEYFATSGYRTRGAGWVYHDDVDIPSWTLGHFIPEPHSGRVPPWAEGWMTADELFEWQAPSSRDLIRERLLKLKAAGVTAEEFQDRFTFRRARGPAVESADVPDNAYYDGKVAEAACTFLHDDCNGSAGVPYFLGIGFVAPHTPFRAPGQYWDLYDRDALTLHANRAWPRGSEEWMAGDSEPAQYYTTDGYTKPWRPDEGQLRELLHGHYATISYLDALVGTVLDAARARADWEDTIVVLTSDHGFSEGQHGYWGKHNMWDASLHAPLLVSGPDRTSGACTRVTEHVDIYPTLCDLAGLPVPDHCEGRTMHGLASGAPAENWKDAALSHRRPMWHDRLQVYDQCNSIRMPRYRYSEYLDATGEVIGRELFDYKTDPEETRNHAGEPEHGPAEQELARRLHSAVETNGRTL